MTKKTRREFISTIGSVIGIGCAACIGGSLTLNPKMVIAAPGNVDACFDGKCGRVIYGDKLPFDTVAKYWSKLPNDKVQCFLCPYNCVLNDGERCRCNGKENHGGTLYDMLYGYIATLHVDSIEKLPIYHRYPGIKTLSFGTAGCALHCKYCQNWQLSQQQPEDTEKYRLKPDDVINLAREHNLEAIALAYTEPLTSFEFSLDVAQAAKKSGLKVFMGTGGYANPQPVKDIAKYLDGVAFGLKGFSDDFYQDVVASGVKLKQVLESLEAFKSAGTHIEVANLVVPTKNDGVADITKLSKYVQTEIGPATPLHFIKFFPHYKYKQLPPTSQRQLEDAARTARDTGLKYVYIGNLPGHSSNNTYCPHCGSLAIQRIGFRVLTVKTDQQGNCNSCGGRVDGVLLPHYISG